ncbi:hypothetical protein ABGB18_11765 [Nonomuraea sp. B12E4]
MFSLAVVPGPASGVFGVPLAVAVHAVIAESRMAGAARGAADQPEPLI